MLLLRKAFTRVISLLVFALVYSLIKELDVKMNEQQVYDCNDVNHVANIKNLLEYSPGYASSTATNEFVYIDTNRHAEERTPEANYKELKDLLFAKYYRGYLQL